MCCKGVRTIKSFALSDNGDLLIEGNQIQIVVGANLTRQKVECVQGTNQGEWPLNIDEGINFSNLLNKPKDEEIVRNEIAQGLKQVDEAFFVDQFSCTYDLFKRKLAVAFTARNDNGDVMKITSEY